MRRLFAIIVASTALSGCASFPSFDVFKSTPPPVTVQLESIPPGADAVTSLGPGCKTPCSVSVPYANTFTVTYSLPRYSPATVPVSVIVNPGDFTTSASTVIDPNPVMVELQPAVPPRRAPVKRAAPKKPRPAAAAAPASAPPPPGASPFPAPAR